MTHREHERLLRISLITAVGVGFFALLEFVNISLFFPMSNGKITWELGRTISTL